ncbi:DUF1266 domain-containing protein [Brevibacillus ginsengisoli]|uniref:DUF1266 domain-containing protein n=1 Tax=Brevibacillus ginsengisoli TaxID=363854 RepID=UPI003CEE20B0
MNMFRKWRLNHLQRRYIRGLSFVCMNGTIAYYFALFGFKRIADILYAKRHLKRWGIHNDYQLHLRLKWLLEEGNRQKYNEVKHFLSVLSETERSAYLQSISNDKEKYVKARIVNEYLRRFPEAGVIAYDYAIYLYLCQLGIASRYLDRKVTEKNMLVAARLIQQTFIGWDEYFTAYIAGERFEGLDDSCKVVQEKSHFLAQMYTKKSSPVHRIPWKLDLQ